MFRDTIPIVNPPNNSDQYGWGYYGFFLQVTFTLPPMTPDALGPTLHALARAHRARLAALLAPHGLHPGQDLLLLAIWNTPGMGQSDLATHLGVEPPTVTRMVQRLERAGMVERRPDPHDARGRLVFATPRSRMLEPMVRRAWSSLDELLIGELGDAEARKLQKLAEAATGVLRESSSLK